MKKEVNFFFIFFVFIKIIDIFAVDLKQNHSQSVKVGSSTQSFYDTFFQVHKF